MLRADLKEFRLLTDDYAYNMFIVHIILDNKDSNYIFSGLLLLGKTQPLQTSNKSKLNSKSPTHNINALSTLVRNYSK